MRCGSRGPSSPEALRTALAVLLLAVSAASCGLGGRFEDSLARLDAAMEREPGKADTADIEKLLARASRRAESSSEWLRLLSRAFRAAELLGDPGIAARAADSARRAYPTYEDIALCACRAYMDSGRAGDALALFPVPLDPGVRGAWFAEAFLRASAESGREARGAGDAEVLRRISEYARRGEPAIDAALLRMLEGDRGGAAFLLRQARNMGAAVSPDLAWDAGVPDLLLSEPDGDPEPADLLKKAEAALLLDERGWAREYLVELTHSYPAYSWKPYTALASLEEDEGRREFWYSRMADLFPEDPSAIRAYAAHLARTGRASSALGKLESPAAVASGEARTAVLAAEIRIRFLRDGTAHARALRISNAFPDDPYAQEWALGILAAAERYPEAAEIYRQLKARGLDLDRPWYFEALSRILEGRLEEAVSIVERDGPAEAGPEAPFTLGVLYAQVRNYGASAERFRIAASRTADPEGKARALTEMGKSLAAAGDRSQAREAWAAALSVCPDYSEALRLYGSR